MGLESATDIYDLNAANPTATDDANQGDDHLRLIKSVLQATFLQGVVASLPAAGNSGRYYFATDTDELYLDNGASWENIGSVSLTNVLIKDSNYTIQAADYTGYDKVIVHGNISANSVTITMPTTTAAPNVEFIFMVDADDGVGSTYKFQINNSSAVEQATLYYTNDCVTLLGESAGPWHVYNEKFTFTSRIEKTADDTVNNGTYTRVFTTGYAVDVNIGAVDGGWDSVNDYWTAPFACRVLVFVPWRFSTDRLVSAVIRINNVADTMSDSNDPLTSGAYIFNLSAGDDLYFYARNDVGTSQTLEGDTANASHIMVEILERYR